MAVLSAIVFGAAAGFAFVVVVTIIVILGVHQEERYMTLEHKTAPSAMAQLARIILGRYVRKEQNGITGRDDEPNGSREHSTSSRS